MGVTPVCQITEDGIIRPAFDACLAYVQGSYRSIYGQDVYLGADSQDGQFMALLANAIHDCNGETVAAYNAFSPASAQGEGLSSVVKINGIRRKRATYSSVDLLLVGQVGATITDAAIRDPDGLLWDIPDTTIPVSGQVLVTATCRTIGSIALPARSVDTANRRGAIATPQLGWQSALNPAAATVGQPVETDTQLRLRQGRSVGLPAQTIIESMAGALLALSGVNRVRVHENDGSIPDANGIPGHALAVIVDGGDAEAVADLIAAKKSPGVGTFGSTLVPRRDAYGIPHPIRFFRLRQEPVAWYVAVRPKAGYTRDVEAEIRARLAGHVAAFDIGETLSLADAYPAARLKGDARSASFDLLELRATRADLSTDAYGEIGVDFDAVLTAAIGDVTIRTITT